VDASSIILYSANGTNWTLLASGTSAATTTPAGLTGSKTNAISGVDINNASLTSNFDGDTTNAHSSSATTSIVNKNSSARTLYLAFGVDGFTSPTVLPLTLTTAVGQGTTLSTGTVASQSWVNNTLASAGASSALWQTGATAGIATPLNGPDGVSAPILSALISGYAINQQYKVLIGGNKTFNFSGSTTVAATPEPTSMALVGIGCVGLIGYGVSRRKTFVS